MKQNPCFGTAAEAVTVRVMDLQVGQKVNCIRERVQTFTLDSDKAQ